MLDHAALNVRDGAAARAFYERALEPLGYTVAMELGEHVGFRSGEGELDFWLSERGESSAPMHLAFRAPDRQSVDAYHAAALAAGGVENGPPGVRAEFHESYYAAFVLDPEGNNIEAVCQTPP
jgi:catechol 2,3-dioxygenase-like lactoylglutathione lyase family enzyme